MTELPKELHRIVNEAIRAQEPGDDQVEGLTFDLSQIDLEKLRAEFGKKVRRPEFDFTVPARWLNPLSDRPRAGPAETEPAHSLLHARPCP